MTGRLDCDRQANFGLEVERPSRHIGNMAESPSFTIKIEPDAGRPERFRWKIIEKGKVRDTSTYSFPTQRKAQADANEFLRKLNATWAPKG
jgi:hypothetical protein